MSEQSVEEMIAEKGLRAPRVIPQDIEDAIASTQFHVFDGSTVTVCLLTLQNGYGVVGTSAAASPANFDAEVGERVALDDAKRQIWPLLGYALRERLAPTPESAGSVTAVELARLRPRLLRLAGKYGAGLEAETPSRRAPARRLDSQAALARGPRRARAAQPGAPFPAPSPDASPS
jgi:hypothetical protein